jgi:hypothetical protein
MFLTSALRLLRFFASTRLNRNEETMKQFKADLLYGTLRYRAYEKLIHLPFRYYRTADGDEHSGHLVPPGLMQELCMVMRRPLTPPDSDHGAEPGWLPPKNSPSADRQ